MSQNSFFRSVAPAAVLTLGAVGLVRAFDPGAASLLEGTASAATKTTGKTAATAPQSGSSTSGSSGTAASCSTATEKTGPVVQTRWGPVQVAATIANGRVCAAHAVVWPSGDGNSAQISASVIPVLDQRASSQGVAFDAVSGATYTSDGYRQSLQSLIDSLKK